MTDFLEAVAFNTRVEADLARTYLESYGLHPIIFDGDDYNYSEGALIGVRLMVLDSEFREARKLLDQYAKEDVRSGRGRSPPD